MIRDYAHGLKMTPTASMQFCILQFLQFWKKNSSDRLSPADIFHISWNVRVSQVGCIKAALTTDMKGVYGSQHSWAELQVHLYYTCAQHIWHLKMQSTIQFCELNSQSNYTPPFRAPEARVLIGWDCLWLGLRYYVCFPFTGLGLCMNRDGNW